MTERAKTTPSTPFKIDPADYAELCTKGSQFFSPASAGGAFSLNEGTDSQPRQREEFR